MSLELKGTERGIGHDRRYYMIRVQVDGRRVVVSSGTRDFELAELRHQQVLDTLRNDPGVTQKEIVEIVRGEKHAARVGIMTVLGLTLEQAFARCFHDPQIWGRIKAQRTYAHNTRHVKSFFGPHRHLQSISSEDVKLYINAQLAANNAPGTVNRRLACLGRMFKAMQECSDGPKTIPRFRYLKEEGARKFTLSYDQENSVFKAVEDLDQLRPGPQRGPPRKLDAHRYLELFQVLVETGMRLGEALSLRWGDLTMTASDSLIKLHRIKKLKTGRARTVPMTETCRTVFERVRQRDSHPSGPFADLNKRRGEHIWSRAVKSARIDDPECVIHCLRHTCATRLLRATGNLVLVRDWLGHTTIQTTADIYAHIETESMLLGAAVLGTSRRAHQELSRHSA